VYLKFIVIKQSTQLPRHQFLFTNIDAVTPTEVEEPVDNITADCPLVPPSVRFSFFHSLVFLMRGPQPF
jgi:hypothetical protein